ncbi:hypothetical protein PENSPDRAFT_645993 [Peniophora sp. CONT]|nr:hypothetical protein PENSPDRAFT_645993 [Peniophora sp. CONT]
MPAVDDSNDNTAFFVPSYPHDDDDRTRGRLRHRTRQRSGVDAASTTDLPATRDTSPLTRGRSPSRRSTSPQPPPPPPPPPPNFIPVRPRDERELPYPQYSPREEIFFPGGPEYLPVPPIPQAEPRYQAHDPWSHRRCTHSPPISLAAPVQPSRPYGESPMYPGMVPLVRPQAPYENIVRQQQASGSHAYPSRHSPAYHGSSASPWPSSATPYTYVTPPPAVPAGQPGSMATTYDWSRQGASNTTSVFGQEPLLDLGKILLVSFPQELYMLLLLRLPRFYHSRVAKVFEDAELSTPDIIRIYTTTAQVWQERQTSRNGQHPKRINIAKLPVPSWNATAGSDASDVTPAMAAFKDSWEDFISSLLQEWNTLNIISALLSASILTLLSLDGAADDPITRTAAVLSLLCSLWSIVYASTYIVRFGPMRKMHKAASWAKEAKERTTILWNVWALLAMPAVWLLWSLIAFMVAIMSYVWRTNSANSPDSRMTSASAALGTRIAISCVLGIGLVYFLAMLNTFRRYGEKMDNEWRKTVSELANQAWLQQKAGVQPSQYPFYFGSVMHQQQPMGPYPPPYPPASPPIPIYQQSRRRRRSRSSSPESFAPRRRSRSPPRRHRGDYYPDVEPLNQDHRDTREVRRSSLRSPTRPPRRSSTGDSLSVRLRPTPSIFYPSNSNLSLSRPVSRPSLDQQLPSGDRDAIPLSTISERTEPLTPPTIFSVLHSREDRRSLGAATGFDAFRAVALFNINLSSQYGVPPQLHRRGMTEDVWQKFLEDVGRAWQTGFLPDLDQTGGRQPRLMPPEAVFYVCRIWASGPCVAYRVQPLLCEEWLETGLVSYAVYVLDATDTPHDLRRAFHKLPEDVQKLVLLWKEPTWDANYRTTWTIHRVEATTVAYDPVRHHSTDRSEDRSSVPLAHNSSEASTTMLGTGLSDSPQSVEREVAQPSGQESAQERSPDAHDDVENDARSRG